MRPMPATMGRLQRRLGLVDAIVIGVGSMVGAGVFAVWSPAAGAAGGGLLIGLLVAGVVAFCNATSSAQLAAIYQESGGTYVYARHRLGPAWGHLAGWGFVVGKTASCAAMAMTVGAYLWPVQARLVAVLAVGAIVAVNVGGLARTVAVTRVLLAMSLIALLAVVVAGWSGDASLDRIDLGAGTFHGVLRSGGFIFFAFAGYARVATLGEEVRDPQRVIPRAIVVALTGVLALYFVVAVTALAAVPADALAASGAPLRLVVENGSLKALAPVARIGAGLAALGVLLNLIPGISRTVLAMARRRELPATLAVVDERRSLPLRAELTVAAVVVAVVLVTDLRGAIGFSSVGVLAYYALTNASTLRLADGERRFPLPLAIVGLVGCIALALALPLGSVVIGAIVLMVGVLARAVVAFPRRTPRARGT
jgi:APA family basic amino acid/polyamine antiporter